MTDTQLTALIATLVTAFGGGLAGLIRWAVSRIVKALDRNTTAHLENAVKMAELSTKIGIVFQWVGDHTPVTGIPIQSEPADFDTLTPTPVRARTAPPAIPTEYAQRIPRTRKP